MKQVDLNCDLGESFGRFKVGNDEAIMPFISSCNIACGFHGGDPSTIEKTIDLATAHGVSIGAHPAFPDLMGFGRRRMTLPPSELKSIVKYQIAAVKGLAESKGERLQHVKPHGALYNTAEADSSVAEVILEAIAEIDPKLIVFGPSMNQMSGMADKMGMRFVSEVFSDRNYTDEIKLVNRMETDAMITNEVMATEHVLRMVESNKVKTLSGGEKTIHADTICIHGDQPNAVKFASHLRSAFQDQGIEIVSFANR